MLSLLRFNFAIFFIPDKENKKANLLTYYFPNK